MVIVIRVCRCTMDYICAVLAALFVIINYVSVLTSISMKYFYIRLYIAVFCFLLIVITFLMSRVYYRSNVVDLLSFTLKLLFCFVIVMWYAILCFSRHISTNGYCSDTHILFLYLRIVMLMLCFGSTYCLMEQLVFGVVDIS